MSHAGDLLAELLVRYGVTRVFGQPGGQTAALYDGLARRAGSIRHTLVRDERSAAYAADAFARLTGRPGVCDVTVGPGATKLTDGLVESRNASVPVVALVGELPRDWAPYREMGVASQGFDQLAFLSAISKSALWVPSVASLPALVRTAFRLATSGRPGPVALIVPHDVLDADWRPDDADLEVDTATVAPPPTARSPPPTASSGRRRCWTGPAGRWSWRAGECTPGARPRSWPRWPSASTRWWSPASRARGRWTRRRRARPAC